MEPIDISQSKEIYTVSRLNSEVRLILEGSFSIFWIEGEISNFISPQSGHWYFSLKDANAQIRCAMFRQQNRRLLITPKDGMHVLLKARVSLYEGRGDFQLIVEDLQEAGLGKLQQAFEALKKRLSEAGLFALERKKKLPVFAKCVGIVTSPTGAAIRDILHVLKRRFTAVSVIIYPTLVQGELAAANIVDAIRIANQRKECDILIIARGGGSLEDLWPFNEEIVAHAIYQSDIPTITGIGHEIDFTIADFVSDVRAPTPSAAAELSTPNQITLLTFLQQQKDRLIRAMYQTMERLQQHLHWKTRQLDQQHPKKKLMHQMQQLDFYEAAFVSLQEKLLSRLTIKLNHFQTKLIRLNPLHAIHFFQHRIALLQHKLEVSIAETLKIKQEFLISAAAKLDALSPLATLQRGFSIATTENRVLMHANEIKQGDNVNIRLYEGSLDCLVINVKK
ncbi:MAG: exodeoxyribonuclease VII large subunit [Gammaproteobacteria bacterium]|nr:exodeoxyribonuclease VII large subunit [Gammaproteobacteria bacterium]